MKAITVRMVKGNSVIFADIMTHDAQGAKTEDQALATGYYVNGACGSHSNYTLEQKAQAFDSFYTKIGMKVADGYVAERV